jgi:hypothetical protein
LSPKKIFVSILLLLLLGIYTTAQAQAVRLFFFYDPICLKCISLKNYVQKLQRKYPLEVKYFNTAIQKNYEILILLEKKYKAFRIDTPEIFIGGTALIGKKDITEKLEPRIKSLLAQGGCPWPDDIRSDRKGLVEERYETFTLLTVLSAGLVDGINPCAFATIVFFVSFLSFIGRKRREILLIGTFFTAAVFCTYLLIGLGAFRFLQALGMPFFLSRMIFYAVGIVALALGVLNLYDYYRFKKGMLSEMALQLPAAIKRMIHAVIRANQATSGLLLVLSASATGFLISILESICTGQVYLPTIVFILKTQGLRARALSFLLLYNLVFIFPLVLIFALTMLGATSDWFGKIMKQNIGAVKILTALFFFGLGILLILM